MVSPPPFYLLKTAYITEQILYKKQKHTFFKKSLETYSNFCITLFSQSEWVINIIELLFWKEVNLFKSKEWMPRVVEPMKDVIGCEKL